MKVDLKSHTTEDGRDFTEINSKGYVPVLALNDRDLLTENIAILSWIADRDAALAPDGELGKYRLLEPCSFPRRSTRVSSRFLPRA